MIPALGATRDLDLLIIGGGVAGLSAGIFAVRSGYRVAIVEMAVTPGGLCTSWWRRGYRFDGSVAGLAGTHPDMPIHRLWQDLGVVDYCPLYDPEEFGTVVDPQGRAVTIFADIDRLEGHLLQSFPADQGPIGEFAGALRACTKLDIPFRGHEGRAAILDGPSLSMQPDDCSAPSPSTPTGATPRRLRGGGGP